MIVILTIIQDMELLLCFIFEIKDFNSKPLLTTPKSFLFSIIIVIMHFTKVIVILCEGSFKSIVCKYFYFFCNLRAHNEGTECRCSVEVSRVTDTILCWSTNGKTAVWRYYMHIHENPIAVIIIASNYN